MRPGALAFMFLAVVTATSAAERKPLPIVDLTAADGRTIRSDAVARDGTWILVYVHRGCAGCEAPLAGIGGLEIGDADSRIVVVAEAADVAALGDLAGRYPDLAGARWLSDPSGALGQLVAPRIAAAVVGLQRAVVEWDLVGIVTDGAQFRAVVRAWLSR